MDVRVLSLFWLSCVGSSLPTVCKINNLGLILTGKRLNDLIRKAEEAKEEKKEENTFQIY
jgi:hypothetical protein